MKIRLVLLITFICLLYVCASNSLAGEEGGGAAEMARKLQDPLANVSAFMTDNDIQFKSGKDGDTTSYSFQLQPVYAFDFPDPGRYSHKEVQMFKI